MKNNNGFAISAILYSIIIIAILVFFLVLALNRNTKVVNDKFINTIKKQLNEDYKIKSEISGAYIAFEYDLNLGTSYVNIADLEGVMVWNGTYAENKDKIEKGFKNPDHVITNITYKDDLNTFLSKGKYTVVSTKFEKTGLGSGEFNTYKNFGLIGVPHFDIIDLNTTSLSLMFNHATSFNQDINHWDTSNITNMYAVFTRAYVFNKPLDNWNLSNVKTIDSMFREAKAFNHDINSWDTSKVESIKNIFYDAHAFNKPLNNWVFTSINDPGGLRGMFANAEKFNQNISSWDVSNILDMSGMFDGATAFNKNLSNWDVNKVTNYANFYRSSGLNLSNVPYKFRNKNQNHFLNIEDITDVRKEYATVTPNIVVDARNTTRLTLHKVGESGTDTRWHVASLPGADTGGHTLVMSFWAKSSTPMTMYLRWGYQTTYRTINLDSTWRFFTVDMSKEGPMNSYQHNYFTKTGTVWLSEIKVEYGTVPTPY